MFAAPASVLAQETPEPQTNLADIEDEVMCTVCGVPLELALEAPQAEAERDFIRELIAEGRTKEEIKDALVVEYGENVLAVPGTEGFDLAAWLIPIGRSSSPRSRSCSRSGAGGETARPSPRRPREHPTDQAGSERLDADMRRYDL